MKNYLLYIFLFITFFAQSQFDFQSAYNQCPSVPKGVLEAVAWTNTRIQHLSNEMPGCSGIPVPYGVMGLHDNGQGYFIETGNKVAALSGISVLEQKNQANTQILAYAKAYSSIYASISSTEASVVDPNTIREVLNQLSEIPDSGFVNLLARDMQVYAIFEFMNDSVMAQTYGFNVHHFDLKKIFGANNYQVLSGKRVVLSETGVTNDKGVVYQPNLNKSLDYSPATWSPAPTCNYSSRGTATVSAITIHTVQGSYFGAISWAQNCNSSVSYHYVIKSSDGQITQLVMEADKAWHVGSENPYTIGYEHEGYVNNAAWYTDSMYQSSAALSKDITNSGYGINPLRTFDGPATSGLNTLGGCIRIKGHQHYPNQSHVDPGINWDWEYYYQLINNTWTPTVVSNLSGTLTDTGGAANNYQDDERAFWLIQPAGAQSITLDFTSFDLETDWDYLYIYDGDSLDANLIGVYTGTTSPGTIISSGGSLLLEFRSDCNTTAPGWVANYQVTVSDQTPPTTSISQPQIWYNDDFTIDFTDADAQSGIADRYYLLGKKQPIDNDWTSDGAYHFTYESFEDNANNWLPVTGSFTIENGAYRFADSTEQNSNVYTAIDQTNTNDYLYDWNQMITSTENNQRAGIHFFCDNPNLPNRGNSYFIYLRENDDKVQIYSVDNDVFTLQEDIPYSIDANQWYNVKTIYRPLTGEIKVWINDSLIGGWEDVTPLTTGGFVSFRSGGCSVLFDDLHIYNSRGSQALVPAGFSDFMSIESENATPTGMALSLALDSANNWSAPAMETFLLDFTAPTVNYVNDGTSNDIDTFTTAQLYANWDIEDIHSSIAYYEVAIGTLPNLDNIVAWSNQGLNASFGTVLTNPVYGQVYYTSVRTTNNADLDNLFITNGQRYIDDLNVNELDLLGATTIYPNPSDGQFSISSSIDDLEVIVYDMQGRILTRQMASNGTIVDLSTAASGQYQVLLRKDRSFKIEKLILKK